VNKSNNRLVRLIGLFALSCAAFASNAAQTVVVGPVEKVASKSATLTVLGQTFLLPAKAAKAAALSVGAYVVVAGDLDSRGTLVATSVKVLPDAYVPGATQIYLQGAVDRYSAAAGLVQIGDLKILVSQALSTNAMQSFLTGDVVELVGTQAVSRGPVWATTVHAIQGTGALAIQGTGALAIQGTSSLAIQGTGALAIQGTGALAIQGTGVQAIQGTGSLAIQGTGKLAIQGTGALAIQGTGTQAIQGTGKLAIQGTGSNLN
jgi:hypothetical protein